MNRVRPIRNLYFRWGKQLGLSAEDCARALAFDGLIELTQDQSHYCETELAKALESEIFDARAKDVLMTEKLNKVNRDKAGGK